MLYFLEDHFKKIIIILLFILVLWYFLYNNYYSGNIISIENNSNIPEVIIKQNNSIISLNVDNNDELNNKKNEKNDKEIINNISLLTFDDKWLKFNKYDSFQAYIYPSKYSVECISDNSDLCSQISKKYNMISEYSIWFRWWDFRIWKDFELNLDDINNKINWDILLSNMLNWIYLWKESANNFDNYKKYFSFKKVDNSNEITLNSMEVWCVDSIKNSIIPWTFDFENIIMERVEKECNWLWDISWIEIVLWDNKKIKNNIKLNINISEVLISYTFFTKKWLKYEKQMSKNINVKKNILIYSKKEI